MHALAAARVAPSQDGAGEGVRTLDINLGKVALYQLSYARTEVCLLPGPRVVARGCDITATRRASAGTLAQERLVFSEGTASGRW